MDVVYKTEDRGVRSFVALKFLPDGVTHDPLSPKFLRNGECLRFALCFGEPVLSRVRRTRIEKRAAGTTLRRQLAVTGFSETWSKRLSTSLEFRILDNLGAHWGRRQVQRRQ
jgi:hypothetical protein